MKKHVACLFLAAVTSVFANTVDPGSVVTPDTFSVPGSGTWLAAESVPISGADLDGDAVFTGILNAAVFAPTSGGLDFFYQFFNNASSADAVPILATSNFQGFSTDVGTVSGTPFVTSAVTGSVPFVASIGDVPALVARDLTADTITYLWTGGQIVPGSQSAVLEIATNASAFTQGGTFLQDGGQAKVATFEPVASAAIPEPGFYGCLATIMALMFLFKGRKLSGN